jgi:CBS-domain-containing membrane protein
MKVREIMTRDVVAVGPDAPVHRIARLMCDRGVSGLPVVDASGRLAGIVTELDLIVRNTRLEPPAFFQILDGRIPLESPAHFEKRLRHILGTRAADVMTETVVTVGADQEVEELAALMVSRGVNPVPVLEPNGSLAGIVSRADIVRTMAREIRDEPSDQAP